MRSYLSLLTITLMLSSSCRFFFGKKGSGKSHQIQNTQTVLDKDEPTPVKTLPQSNDTTTGQINDIKKNSIFEVNEDNASLAGVSVLFPANSLSAPSTISLRPAVAIAASDLESLKLNTDIHIESQGKSLIIDSDKSTDPNSEFYVSIPQPKAVPFIDDTPPLMYPLVVYRKFDYSKDKVIVGVIPTSQVSIVDEKFSFQTSHFGVFQVLFIASKGEFETRAIESDKRIGDARIESTATPDSMTPSISKIALNDAIKDGYLSIADTVLEENIISEVEASNFDMLRYAISDDSTDCESAENYAPYITKINEILNRNDGAYKVCVQAMGINSSRVLFSASESFIIDRTTPELKSLTLNPTLDDAILNFSEHTLDDAVFQNIESPPGSMLSYALIDSTATCEDATYESSSPLLSSDFFINHKSYQLCIKGSDVAGNSSFIASNDFTCNFDGPQFTVNLAQDASDGIVNYFESNLNSPLIEIPDGGSSVFSYAILFDSEICDGSVASFLENIPKTADITADGNYFVCVRGLNAIGNYSYLASSTFAYALSGPKISNSELSIQNNANTIALGWQKATDDSGSTALEYRVCQSLSPNLGTIEDLEANCLEIHPYTADINNVIIEDFTPGASYIFNVIVKDPDGNKAIYTQKQI